MKYDTIDPVTPTREPTISNIVFSCSDFSQRVKMLGEHIDDVLSAVLISDGDTREIQFLIEENESLRTVSIPNVPRYDAGAIKIVPASTVQKISLPTTK